MRLFVRALSLALALSVFGAAPVVEAQRGHTPRIRQVQSHRRAPLGRRALRAAVPRRDHPAAPPVATSADAPAHIHFRGTAEHATRLSRARRQGVVATRILSAFRRQQTDFTCGVASACVVSNALRRPRRAATEERFWQDGPSVRTRRQVMDLQGDPGFSLARLGRTLELRGLSVQRRPAAGQNVDAFRRTVVRTLRDDAAALIVNFHGKSLGLLTGGHFSPIAAYDRRTDSVLVVDVAAHRNPHFWVPLRDLHAAMATRDSAGDSRGYLVVR